MLAHIRVLGYLHILIHSLLIIAGIFLTVTPALLAVPLSMYFHLQSFAWLGFLISAFGILILAISLPGALVGLSLINLKPRARTYGIAISILDIIMLNPASIALGAYGLFVLLNPETERIFQGLA